MDQRAVCSVTNNNLITKRSVDYKHLALWFYLCMCSLKSPKSGGPSTVLLWGIVP